MAKIIHREVSRTLHEFRLLPGYTAPDTTPDKISLKTLVALDRNRPPGSPPSGIFLNIPVMSAAMQSVSGPAMGIELARAGGVAVIFCSQPIESQAEMVSRIKNFKGGFVEPVTIHPDTLISELGRLVSKYGFSTFPVVDESGKLLGLLGSVDYDITYHGSLKASERMIPRSELTVGVDITDLGEANALLMESHQSVLPIVDREDRLIYLVFRKDIRNHLVNPLEVVDSRKRLLSAAAINTHDYMERVPALIKAEVDLLVVDSSDGHTCFQERTIRWVRENYPSIPVMGGNVITGQGFDFLVEAGASSVKVGMGGGSICITQEQKGTGRGLATAIIKVVEARDRHYEKTGEYIPVIADGGINTAKDIVIALALGADCVMMGRYFARMEEAPTEKVEIGNRIMKPYWGEGSRRSRAWKAARYNQNTFIEGVEGFVPYAGSLRDNLPETIQKIKSSMSTCGVSNIRELHEKAELEIVSELSIREGKVHDIYMPEPASGYTSRSWGEQDV